MVTRNAFTLTELMIVLVILGVLAALATPNFKQKIDRAKARDAKLNLSTIHNLNERYSSRSGSDLTAGNIAAINTALGLNIIPGDVSYSCDGVICTATGPGGVFVATTTLGVPQSTTNPLCDKVTYPVCP